MLLIMRVNNQCLKKPVRYNSLFYLVKNALYGRTFAVFHCTPYHEGYMAVQIQFQRYLQETEFGAEMNGCPSRAGVHKFRLPPSKKKIRDAPHNSKRQEGDTKQDLYRGLTNIGPNHTKFGCPDDLAARKCIPPCSGERDTGTTWK
jgi:hypothetical protein